MQLKGSGSRVESLLQFTGYRKHKTLNCEPWQVLPCGHWLIFLFEYMGRRDTSKLSRGEEAEAI